MAIVHSEKAAFGPLFVLSVLGLHNIENYADPVFVVSSDKPLIRVGGVGTDDPVPLK